MPAGRAEGARLVVEGVGYRVAFANGSADIALELRRADGAWEPVTATPAGLSFGLLSAAACTTNGLPVTWLQAPAGEALAVAGRVALDPLGDALLEMHFLCADDGLLIGARLEGTVDRDDSLWAPPRLTLVPTAWDGYAFWSQDGQYRAGRIADLAPPPAYAGLSPWGREGDTTPALAAELPGLIVRSAASGVGLGVVWVDGTAWKGSSSFLQRHTPTSLFFYTGYTPVGTAAAGLRWAWLAPFAPGAEAADAARVRALLAQTPGLLAGYRPLAPAIPAGQHRLALDNVGGDWLVLDWLEFAGTFADPEPVAGAPAWVVQAVRKAEDRVEVAVEAQRDVVTITCPSGIGAAEFALPGRPAPRDVCIRLRYAAGKPFPRLEGFEAVSATAVKLPHRITTADGSVEVTLALPAEGGAAGTLRLSWVDAYR
jgi:hypothetical protein